MWSQSVMEWKLSHACTTIHQTLNGPFFPTYIHSFPFPCTCPPQLLPSHPPVLSHVAGHGNDPRESSRFGFALRHSIDVHRWVCKLTGQKILQLVLCFVVLLMVVGFTNANHITNRVNGNVQVFAIFSNELSRVEVTRCERDVRFEFW